jgi:serine/threonine protein kinase
MIIDTSGGRSKLIGFFEATEFLGSGRFSEVYKAYFQRGCTDVALKIYIGMDEKTMNIARNEVDILQALEKAGSGYFAAPRGGMRTFKNHPYFAMEIGEYTGHDSNKKIISLKNIIPSKEPNNEIYEVPEFWTRETFLEFILELCTAVRILHDQEVIHRDLKPSNILLKKTSSDNYIKPFILDFNTSIWMGNHLKLGGTERYLPPEVKTGSRKQAAMTDDLWAVASIIWELIYGFEQNIEKGCTPHGLIDFTPPEGLISVLLKALLPIQTERFSDAAAFYSAVESILHHSNGEWSSPNSDEIIWATGNKNNIKDDIIEVLNVGGEILISKEIKDNVEFIFSSLSQMETQTFDLKNDIVQLGTKAIPAIIEECYRIPFESSDFKVISDALGVLAVNGHDLAVRAIDTFCVSSDYNVRSMCLSLCEKLKYFPTNLIYNILEDDSLYLPNEKVYIADLCIQISEDSNVMLALNSYMCREYILDSRGARYAEIRNKIASKMKNLNFDKKAQVIVEDSKMRIWEDLPVYKKLTNEKQIEADKGLLQLFGDAFMSLGQEALDYLNDPGLPSKCQKGKLPIARTFITKLSNNYKAARDWLFCELSKLPPNRDLFYAAERFSSDFSDKERDIFTRAANSLNVTLRDKSIDIPKVFENYIAMGGNEELKILYWEAMVPTLDLVEEKIALVSDLNKMKNILSLLSFYKNKYRERILGIIFNNWESLVNSDFELLVDVLCDYDIPGNMRGTAIRVLNKELDCADRHTAAREGLDRILD